MCRPRLFLYNNFVVNTMPIKNYTTKESSMKSVSKLKEALIVHGAVGIQTMSDAEKRMSALRFAFPCQDGRNIAYSLPCEWRHFPQQV